MIDGKSNSVLAMVSFTLWPLALCYNSQNDRIYCVTANNFGVAVIDGASNQVIASLTTGNAPSVLCYSPQNNKVYCADAHDDRVTVIDGATNSIVRSIPVGDRPWAAAYNPTQNRMYVANFLSSSVSVLRDSASGIEDGLASHPGSIKPMATVVRGALFLAAKGGGQMASNDLLDISGRKVMGLKLGANDIRHLAPGVYFVREAADVGREASSVTKVIVTR